MPSEYRNPDGTLSQGYYCDNCGGTTNMVGTGHGFGKCEANFALVKQLRKANHPTHPVFRVKAGSSK